MSARSAISSIDDAWKPRAANSSPATASICSSRTARGTSRVPARRFSDRATAPSLRTRRARAAGLLAGEALELAAQRRLDALLHDDAEHRRDGLGGQRAQSLERLSHLGP